MKGRFAILVLSSLALSCGSRPEEACAIRLLDLAPAAESRWPRERQRRLPKEIEGLRNFGQLREGKVGRVAMFPEGGGDSRRSLVAPSGTRHRFVIHLPSDAMMRVGLGYMPSPQVEGASVRFVVRVAPSGREVKQKVVDRLVTVRKEGDWLDLDVDLSPWSGQEVELSLMTVRNGSDPQIWAAWSAPEIMSATASESSPDVILISLDTLRADRLGCYGYDLNTSPNLDRLASRGIRFERAVSQAPWTYPSHRSLFTGLYVTARELKESPRLAEVLLDAGYRTEALTGGGQMDFRMGFARGFETYRVFDWIRNMAGLDEWLERSSQRRRFLFLHTYEIHDPYIHTELADDERGGRALGYFDKRKWWGLRGKLTSQEKDYIGSLYDSGIAYTDRQLGALFDLLEESGALERSIVIVTSDHGEQFWEHGTWRHGMNLYDHQIMVPLIVHLPKSLEESLESSGGLSGTVFEQQVRLIDLFPTILDLLGIPFDHRVNGRSLKPLFQGEELAPVDAFAERLNLEHRESKALRTERFKFIYSFPKPIGIKQGLTETWELYDLARDPGEIDNLADRYPDKTAELDARVRTLLELLTDPSEIEEPARELDPDLEERLRALGYLGN